MRWPMWLWKFLPANKNPLLQLPTYPTCRVVQSRVQRLCTFAPYLKGAYAYVVEQSV